MVQHMSFRNQVGSTGNLGMQMLLHGDLGYQIAHCNVLGGKSNCVRNTFRKPSDATTHM